MSPSARRAAARGAMLLHRHPLCTAGAVAVLAAAAAAAAFFLIIVPAIAAVSHVPGQLGRAYVSYYDGVGRQIQQAQRQDGGMP